MKIDTGAHVRQAIIGNYAVPILEERQVWGTTDETRTAYMDSQVLMAHHTCHLEHPQKASHA